MPEIWGAFDSRNGASQKIGQCQQMNPGRLSQILSPSIKLRINLSKGREWVGFPPILQKTLAT